MENVNENVNTPIDPTKNNINTVHKTEESQKSPEAVFTSKNKKNDTFDKAYIRREKLNISVLSGHGEILASVTPDQQHITINNKKGKTPAS